MLFLYLPAFAVGLFIWLCYKVFYKASMLSNHSFASQNVAPQACKIDTRPRSGSGSGSSNDKSSSNSKTKAPSSAIPKPKDEPTNLLPTSNTPSKAPPQPDLPSPPILISAEIPLIVSDLPANKVIACDFAYQPARRFSHPLEPPPSLIRKRKPRAEKKPTHDSHIDDFRGQKTTSGPRSPRAPLYHQHTRRPPHARRTSAPVVPSSLHERALIVAKANQGSRKRAEAGSRIPTLSQVKKKARGQREGKTMASSSLRAGVVAVSDTGTTPGKKEDGKGLWKGIVGWCKGKERSGVEGCEELDERGTGGMRGGDTGEEGGRRRRRDRLAALVRRLY